MPAETWEVWYPKAAATGMLFARGRIEATNELLLHAAPDVINVEVRDAAGATVASGEDLMRTQESPICILLRDGARLTRKDIWPVEAHIGLPVLLHGGEAGILKSWWNAADCREWRWQIELYNSNR